MLEHVFGDTCGPTCQCWNRKVVDSLDGVNIRDHASYGKDREGLDGIMDEHGWLDEEWH